MAIAQGVVLKEYPDGTKTQFRSLDEMIRIRDMMRRDLGVTKKGSGRRYASFSKGL
jgi:hypothetical protein